MGGPIYILSTVEQGSAKFFEIGHITNVFGSAGRVIISKIFTLEIRRAKSILSTDATVFAFTCKSYIYKQKLKYFVKRLNQVKNAMISIDVFT